MFHENFHSKRIILCVHVYILLWFYRNGRVGNYANHANFENHIYRLIGTMFIGMK